VGKSHLFKNISIKLLCKKSQKTRKCQTQKARKSGKTGKNKTELRRGSRLFIGTWRKGSEGG